MFNGGGADRMDEKIKISSSPECMWLIPKTHMIERKRAHSGMLFSDLQLCAMTYTPTQINTHAHKQINVILQKLSIGEFPTVSS